MSQFFFRENVQLKTLQYNACKHTMVTRYVSCNYLSQFLTVHCVTNYGNTQCFPVNNPWNQSIDFLKKETCWLMVRAILPLWYIHGRYGRILYIYDISIWYIHWYYQCTTPIQSWGCWSEWRRKLRSLARSLGDGSLSWRARWHLGHFRTIYIYILYVLQYHIST